MSDIADMLAVKPLTRPLFQFDPGWLFIAAGIAVCAAGVILPAQGDLRALQYQLEQLQGEESRAYARLKAHSDFMDQIDRADPALIRRLAATQLNLVPEGDTPVLLASSATVPVTHWIDSSVQVDIRPPNPAPTSILSRLANGPYRLWMFGGGIMCVFVGLMLGPGVMRRERVEFEKPKGEDSNIALLDADEDEIASNALADDQQILLELDGCGGTEQSHSAAEAAAAIEMESDVALEQSVECEAEPSSPESETANVETLDTTAPADCASEPDAASPQEQFAPAQDAENAPEIELADRLADEDDDESSESESQQVLVVEDSDAVDDEHEDDATADESDQPSSRYHNRLRDTE